MGFIGHAGDVGDDPAKEGVAEVGIFERGAGGAAEEHTFVQPGRKLGLRHWLLAIAPRVVRDEARGVGEEIADPDTRRIRGRITPVPHLRHILRAEEHTSELQSLMRISYAAFCLKKKK